MAWRCLIVDDNHHFCERAGEFLRRGGVDVVGTASTIAEALQKAVALRPDVCLVDIDLGEESGFALAERLASMTGVESTQVVLTSSYAEADFSELISSSPAVGFVPKAGLSAQALAVALGAGQNGNQERSG